MPQRGSINKLLIWLDPNIMLKPTTTTQKSSSTLFRYRTLFLIPGRNQSPKTCSLNALNNFRSYLSAASVLPVTPSIFFYQNCRELPTFLSSIFPTKWLLFSNLTIITGGGY